MIYEVKIYIYYMVSISSSVCVLFCSVKLLISRCESCVIVNMNIRLKNSLMLVMWWWLWALLEVIGEGWR